jgi:hypothetical protein
VLGQTLCSDSCAASIDSPFDSSFDSLGALSRSRHVLCTLQDLAPFHAHCNNTSSYTSSIGKVELPRRKHSFPHVEDTVHIMVDDRQWAVRAQNEYQR